MDSGFERDLAAAFRLSNLLENPAHEPPAIISPPEVTDLARMLSVWSVISTTSSFAQEQELARLVEGFSNDINPKVRKIGAGACGVVLAAEGRSIVFKVSKSGTDNDGYGITLQTDYEMHRRVLRALRNCNARVEVPECYKYIHADDDAWWDQHEELKAAASKDCNFPAPVLVTERILPLPAPARTSLTTTFCHAQTRQAALDATANKDCLVRPYLGSMDGRISRFFSLRNFKFCLNQMIDIGFDYECLAVDMGEALAVMHWKALTDARDVEFVLGSSSTKTERSAESTSAAATAATAPTTTIGTTTTANENFAQREIRLFVLDFNQVQPITLDDAGVQRAVDAFFLNDKYYPRPGTKSKLREELWNSFVRSYAETSAKILLWEDMELRMLPRKFLNEVRCRVLRKQGKPVE